MEDEAFGEGDFGDGDFDNDEDLLLEDNEDGDEDIDPAIYDDPILMVKWLEQKQKGRSVILPLEILDNMDYEGR